ncbi:MAG: hypothetical protein Ct9H300mP16_07260 [Pseudomonadota bacterium]|nr:MAG: hypothetical protein Ct9H300mP16_07260 [Pseudomonadota bacterium]
MGWRLGIDIGGTFTDVVLVNDTDGTIGIARPRPPLEILARRISWSAGCYWSLWRPPR